ncbi:MAG: flagellar basal body-associated FliL family protein [Pseudomonadota bacterium]
MSEDATPKEADPETAESEEDGEETPKKKGMGLIPMAIAGIVAAGAAGGAAFVLTPTASDPDACVIDESHAGESAHDDTSEDCDTNPADDGHDKGDGKKSNDKKKKKADKGGHGGSEGGESTIKPLGEVQHSQNATFLVMEPIVVSITPIGRSRHLKVSLVLETTDDGAEALLENGFYIKDVLNTFLRSVDAAVLEDPASMSRLRAQILRRIRAITPDADVTNVLITEFVLT